MDERDYAHAEHDRRISTLVREGVIAEVGPDGRTARVQFDTDWTSHFLRVLELRSSPKMRTWSAPVVGEAVTVLSASGELGAGLVLRGAPCDAAPAAGSGSDLHVLGAWDDQAQDSYDAAGHVRLLTLPAGGRLAVVVDGATVLALTSDRAELKIGGATLTLQDGRATLSADELDLSAGQVKLAGGGKPVARVGDTVDTKTGLILTGSGSVSAG